jgi:hypothetical protein
MPILARLGWTRFVEFDTTIRAVTNLLRAVAENNVTDCQVNPRLQAELFARCRCALQGATAGSNGGLGALPGTGQTKAVPAPDKPEGKKDVWVPAVPPFVYEEEPLDTWNDFCLMAERKPGQTIRLDCDCISPVWAAFLWLRFDGTVPVGVGISQPKTRQCCTRRGPTNSCRGRVCTDAGVFCRTCGYGMAHAFTVVRIPDLPDDSALRRILVRMNSAPDVGVLDGSVLAGMGAPRADFYGSGESALKWLRSEDLES